MLEHILCMSVPDLVMDISDSSAISLRILSNKGKSNDYCIISASSTKWIEAVRAFAISGFLFFIAARLMIKKGESGGYSKKRKSFTLSVLSRFAVAAIAGLIGKILIYWYWRCWMIPKLMRVDEVASLCGISKSFVYQKIRTGELPSVHIGTAVRVRPEDLSAFIDKNLGGGDFDMPPGLKRR